MQDKMSQNKGFLLLYILAMNICYAALSTSKKMEPPFLLIVGMDAFRWDFIDRANTPNFDRIIEDGVRAKHVKNVFPTKSVPNWYTILSGLYPESHGLVNNNVYDPKIDPKQVLHVSANAQVTDLWKALEPIWITNQRQGGQSGIVNFFGMTAKFNGMAAKYTSSKHRNDTNGEERVDRIVELFSNGSINLGMIYYPDVDHACHWHGPESTHVVTVVEEMDKVVGYLVKKLKEKALYDVMNIIFVADHGQVDVHPNQTIFLNDNVDPSLYIGFQDNPIYSIFPHKVTKTEEIVEMLSKVDHLSVYTKDTMPPKFHYTNNDRIPPILVMADVGWNVAQNRSEKPYWEHIIGEHGYSNDIPKMWPFFVARGPAFNRGLKNAKPFHTVDIYSLMCHVMRLDPAPHNGSLENVKHLFANQEHGEKSSNPLGGLLFICVIIIMIETTGLVVGIFWYKKKVKSMNKRIHDVQLEGLLDNEEKP
ncbi:Bis(5'-adenosyl)-triphosphatase enpp4 [Holothuria leucospilota]|uniref:Bis(5'-adenosyl)-triphosphatase enpp4 n=1 Tax=Holothuria leucospilota TaxID=206669 RepID=A0A9Q0YQN1_HOLLE|nr:Bis(5'-adenosyl)-triphosphatase enpp4 [Holothuria leucospilota]